MFSFRSCFYPLCLPPHVSPPQGHVVFDASGSRMAWTLIEQLQGEHRDVGGWGGQLGGQAGAGLGYVWEENPGRHEDIALVPPYLLPALPCSPSF